MATPIRAEMRLALVHKQVNFMRQNLVITIAGKGQQGAVLAWPRDVAPVATRRGPPPQRLWMMDAFLRKSIMSTGAPDGDSVLITCVSPCVFVVRDSVGGRALLFPYFITALACRMLTG